MYVSVMYIQQVHNRLYTCTHAGVGVYITTYCVDSEDLRVCFCPQLLSIVCLQCGIAF